MSISVDKSIFRCVFGEGAEGGWGLGRRMRKTNNRVRLFYNYHNEMEAAINQIETNKKQNIFLAKSWLRLWLFLLAVFIAIVPVLVYGFFIWPEKAIDQFYVELNKLNYDVYISLPVPQNTTLTDLSLESGFKNIVHNYGRSISANYETTLSQNEILDFYNTELESRGWEHYYQHVYKDSHGNPYYQKDFFRRGTSCIHIGTGIVFPSSGKDDYLLGIGHDFWSQSSSPPKIVFDILNLRYENVYFDKCPRSH